MNSKDLFNAVGSIDEKYIAEAEPEASSATAARKIRFKRYAAVAAAVIIFALGTATIGITTLVLSQRPVGADAVPPVVEVVSSDTIEFGKYYLDGDTSKQYIEVNADTFQLLGVDIEQYVRAFQTWVDPDTGETKTGTESFIAEEIKRYSAPQSYQVVHFYDSDHGIDTLTMAYSYYNDGKSACWFGYPYTPEENKLTYGDNETYYLVK